MIRSKDPEIRSRGLSLVELMVVVSIIAILGAIAVPKFNEFTVKANDASALVTVNNVIKMMDLCLDRMPNFDPASSGCPTDASHGKFAAGPPASACVCAEVVSVVESSKSLDVYAELNPENLLVDRAFASSTEMTCLWNFFNFAVHGQYKFVCAHANGKRVWGINAPNFTWQEDRNLYRFGYCDDQCPDGCDYDSLDGCLN